MTVNKRARITRLTILLLLLGMTMALAVPPALASGDHGDTGALEYVVPLEGKSGASLILARLYNDNRLLYALVVTATMAILGIVVAQVTELILKLIGIK